MEDGWYERDGVEPDGSIFTYKGFDYVRDIEHGGSLLLTQQCIDDSKLAQYIDTTKYPVEKLSDYPEQYKQELEDGYEYILRIIHLAAIDGGDDEDEELTLAANFLPVNLLDLNGCVVDHWREG